MLSEALPAESCFKWALFGREPLSQWTVGRTTLLGDAAHPMLPFLGMGATTALQDGLVLARCFRLTSSVDEALACYRNAQLARANFIMEGSLKRGKQTQRDHPETFNADDERNEQSFGLFDYDAGEIELQKAANG